MAIPFPPGGPQVQAALQNPARFPDQRLQQYAQGQQPTGQVPPPMAANELTIRNAQRQAASRQSAMQNNPQNSPTVFQQKDMELQQKAQQLAAMQQQMQQKEQQLGVVGALMAKKAQDLQAREAMGVAQLPVNPNMFTAMDGGIVFNGGGQVQRFNGQTGSQPRSTIGYSGLQFNPMGVNVPERPQLTSSSRDERDLFEELEEKVRTGTATPSERRRYNSLRALSLDMYGSRRSPSTDVPDYTQDIAGKDFTYPTRAVQDKTTDDKKETTGKKGSGESTGQRVPTTPQSNIFKEYMSMVIPHMGESEAVREAKSGLLGSIDRTSQAYAKSQQTPEQRAAAEKEERDRLAQEYAEYTKGRAERRAKTQTALEGEAPTFQERIGRGLASLPANLKGVRLGGALAAIAGGASEVDADYRKRKLAAAKFAAEAEELDARADLAEQRGQTAAARQLSAMADLRRKQEFEITSGLESRTMQVQSALLSDAQSTQANQLKAAMGAAGADITARQQERLKLLELQNQRPSALQERLALFKSDPATYEKLFGDKTSGRRPGPRDIVAVQQHVAGLPLEQLPLSDEVRLAIKNNAKSLKDPTSRLNQEIQEARNKVAQKILSSGITDADDILSGR